MNKINQLFVPYHMAVKLEKVKFNEPCLAFYTSSKILKPHFQPDSENFKTIENSNINVSNYVSAPLWEQVVNWCREKHNLHIDIYRVDNNWAWRLFDTKKNCYITNVTIEFSRIPRTYYTALEQAIYKVLEQATTEIKSEMKYSNNEAGAREFLFDIFNKMSIRISKNFPEGVSYYVGENKIFDYNIKNNYLWVSYTHIWLVLQTRFNLNYQQTKHLIKDMVENTLGWRGVTACFI